MTERNVLAHAASIAAILGLGFSLIGCESIRQATGAAKLPPDEQQFESQKTALRDGVIQREETTAVRHFIDQLKAKANIQLGHAFGGATSSSE